MDNLKTKLLSEYPKKKHGPRKNEDFYQTIVEIFTADPEMGKKIINHLSQIGYYKDYLYIMELSDNKDLTDYLLSDLADQIRAIPKDPKKRILAKWLPREKTHFDRSLNFVEKITAILYPTESKNMRKKKYRQMIAAINQEMNTIEIHLCQKNYDAINISTLPGHLLRRYHKTFLRYPQLKDRLTNHFHAKYATAPLPRLLFCREKLKTSRLEREILEKKIQDNIRNNTMYPQDTMLVLDITAKLYNLGKEILFSKTLHFLNNHEEIIINSPTPQLLSIPNTITLDEKLETIRGNISSCKKLNISLLQDLTRNKYKSIHILTTNPDFGKLPANFTVDLLCPKERNKTSRTQKDLESLQQILNC